MSALVRVELSRFWARRLTRVVLVFAVLGIIAAGVSVFFTHHKAAPEQFAATIGADVFERCMRGEDGPPFPPPGDTDERAEMCGRMIDFAFQAPDPRFHLESLDDIFKGTSGVLIIMAWLLAASFIGAEWHTRAMTTLLTWESRRARVLAAKAIAAVASCFLLAVILQLALGLALAPSGVLRGTTEGFDAVATAGVAMRAAAVTAIGALIGFALGAIGRHTAAALGIGFAYLVIIENIIAGVKPGWRSWILIGNIIAFISGDPFTAGVVGRSITGAGILLSIYAGGAFLVALALFRRRDVG